MKFEQPRFTEFEESDNCFEKIYLEKRVNIRNLKSSASISNKTMTLKGGGTEYQRRCVGSKFPNLSNVFSIVFPLRLPFALNPIYIPILLILLNPYIIFIIL